MLINKHLQLVQLTLYRLSITADTQSPLKGY